MANKWIGRRFVSGRFTEQEKAYFAASSTECQREQVAGYPGRGASSTCGSCLLASNRAAVYGIVDARTQQRRDSFWGSLRQHTAQAWPIERGHVLEPTIDSLARFAINRVVQLRNDNRRERTKGK